MLGMLLATAAVRVISGRVANVLRKAGKGRAAVAVKVAGAIGAGIMGAVALKRGAMLARRYVKSKLGLLTPARRIATGPGRRAKVAMMALFRR